jgi:hypothetical protein
MGDPGQFTIESSVSDPLTGDNITFTNSTVQPYGTNLFYKTIPFEYLKTFEDRPQLIVSVNDLPAVCHNLNCNYTYVEPTGKKVNSFTYDANTQILTLVGTDLPTTIASIQHIAFAKTLCKLDNTLVFTGSTQIQCTLAREPTCGSHVPELVAK